MANFFMVKIFGKNTVLFCIFVENWKNEEDNTHRFGRNLCLGNK